MTNTMQMSKVEFTKLLVDSLRAKGHNISGNVELKVQLKEKSKPKDFEAFTIKVEVNNETSSNTTSV